MSDGVKQTGLRIPISGNSSGKPTSVEKKSDEPSVFNKVNKKVAEFVYDTKEYFAQAASNETNKAEMTDAIKAKKLDEKGEQLEAEFKLFSGKASKEDISVLKNTILNDPTSNEAKLSYKMLTESGKVDNAEGNKLRNFLHAKTTANGDILGDILYSSPNDSKKSDNNESRVISEFYENPSNYGMHDVLAGANCFDKKALDNFAKTFDKKSPKDSTPQTKDFNEDERIFAAAVLVKNGEFTDKMALKLLNEAKESGNKTVHERALTGRKAEVLAEAVKSGRLGKSTANQIRNFINSSGNIPESFESIDKEKILRFATAKAIINKF